MDTGIKKLFAPLMGIALATVALLSAGENAASAQAHCYRLEFRQSPIREAHPKPHSETWCYEALSSPAGATYIYNADDRAVKPELAMVLKPDGTLKHASLLAGELSYHEVQSRLFNPFSLPLAEPRGQAPVVSPPLAAGFDQSREQTLQLLLRQPVAESPALTAAGLLRAKSRIIPWRGYWWPFQGQPLNKPMRKLDNFVAARTGTNPGAVLWESRNHRYSGVWWEGHCNGWAAAAVLRREPRRPRVDDASGTTFSVSDQKGLLAELDFCANAKMFGHRYNGPGDDPVNITPDLFHKTLQYYIGKLHKPVMLNLEPTGSINNNPITAYVMDVQGGPEEVMVRTVLTLRSYDGEITNKTGPAPSYTKEYRYSLQLDENGTPVSGKWLSKDPGFLWVALSPGGNCSENNPNVKPAWVGGVLALP